MTKDELGKNLANLMQREVTLLEEFARIEKSIRSHIHESDWDGLNDDLSMIEPVTAQINETEEGRHKVFTSLCGSLGKEPWEGFYHIIVHLEPGQRDECARLYRVLKLSVLTIQGITFSIDAHVRAVSLTVGKALDQLFPHRKGKLYSKTGTSVAADAGPMLVNHRL
ncbi:MAG: hypothetical protein JXB03_03385 [Spirochaetales bacterium]|nr:hypothetical protein [Spirochaetales bacterium]